MGRLHLASRSEAVFKRLATGPEQAAHVHRKERRMRMARNVQQKRSAVVSLEAASVECVVQRREKLGKKTETTGTLAVTDWGRKLNDMRAQQMVNRKKTTGDTQRGKRRSKSEE